jgi:hypothetical protein
MPNFNLDNYVPVHERIEKFYAKYPNGRITTNYLLEAADGDNCVFKASVFREKDDAEPSATGHAYEINGSSYINKTSYIENCETSAIGRALANLGIEVQRGIASREEMQKVERMNGKKSELKAAGDPVKPTELEHLKKMVWEEAKQLGMDLEALNAFTQDHFGGDYPVAKLNEKQLSAVSIELAKKLKATGAKA